MVHERKRVVPGQRDEPQRQLGQVHRERVLVHAVQAPLRHRPHGVQQRDHVRRQRGHAAVRLPGRHQALGELPARLDQERARPHRRVADLQRQDPLRPGPRPQVLQHRPQRRLHDGLGQLPGRVVRARAAALLRRLQVQAALRDRARRVRRQPGADGGDRVLHVAGRPERRRRLAGQVAAGLVLETLAPLAPLARQQGVEVHDDVLGPHRDAPAPGAADREAHHRLVDRADLLDVQRPVGQPLTVQHQQRLQDAVDAAVRDPRGCERRAARLRRALGSALDEGVGVRVEQLALARRQPQPPVPAAVEHQPEQRQQARPGAVTLVHRVRVAAGVGAQPLEQAGNRVVTGPYVVLREQLPVLRVQQEDQPEQHGQQPAVDLLRVLPGQLAQDPPRRRLVRRLEAAQQLPERAEHLLREAPGDLVLVAAALGEQVAQPLAVGRGEDPVLAEQHVQRAQEGPAGDLRQPLDGEGDVARRLVLGGVDQAEAGAVAQQAHGDAHLAQQALEAGLGARLPAAGVVVLGRAVEVGGAGDHADQHQPPLRRRGVGGRARVGDRVRGPQHVAVVGQGEAEVVGQGPAGQAPQVVVVPVEDVGEEAGQVVDGGLGLVVVVVGDADLVAQPLLQLDDLPARHDAGADEGGGRDDEADRLQVADPLAVLVQLGAVAHRRPPTRSPARGRPGPRARPAGP